MPIMDQYSGKRGVGGGLVTRRKGYASFKDAATEEDQNAQFCNRIGCNGRIKYGQNAKIVGSDKAKCTKLVSSCSSNGSSVTGKSVASSSTLSSGKKANSESKRKLSSQLKFDPSDSSLSSETEAPEPTSSLSSLSECSSGSLKSGEVTETGSSSASSVQLRKMFHRKSSLLNRNSLPTSAAPLLSKSSSMLQVNKDSRTRCGLKNLKCNSTARNVAASCSSPEPESVSKSVTKKRSSEGDSSLSDKGNKINAVSHVPPSTSGISIYDSSRSSNPSGEEDTSSASVWAKRSTNENIRTRLSVRQVGRSSSSVRQPAVNTSQVPDNGVPANVGCMSSSNPRRFLGEGSSGAASVRTRRSMNESTRTRLSSQLNGRNGPSIRQPALGISQVPDNELPFCIGTSSSVPRFSASSARSYSLSSSNRENLSSTMPRDYLYRYSIDGIAEVLLALDRVERNEELTHEQVLALETSLFLSSLNLYDQHRGMRLDIDNMSYEELLALEERMGTVSTALSEEALSSCLKKSAYLEPPSKLQPKGSSHEDVDDDAKCSICQEEYAVGDEIGKLVECQHGYHVDCINQWLRMKNWCPICKTSAAPPATS